MCKFIEHTSIYGTDLSDDENAKFMMFVNLLAEIITQGVWKIYGEFAKFIHAEFFEESLEEKIVR
jgi:hypothetical protein